MRLTTRGAFIAGLFVVVAPAWSADFATCILDKAPGMANNTAAQAVYQLCLQQHPGGFQSVGQGSGRGVLGFNSGAECTAKKASDTRSERAAELVGIACRKLFDDAPAGLKPFTGKLD